MNPTCTICSQELINVANDLIPIHRCSHSEKKYGSPVACEHCKLVCAFPKSEDARKKVIKEAYLEYLECATVLLHLLGKPRIVYHTSSR